MLYLDTNVVVAVVTEERPTVQVRDWLAAQPAGQVAVSDWVLTETSSALSLKERIGTLDAASRAVSRQILGVLLDDVLTLVPVDREAFRLATNMCERVDLGLRGPDALHLGIAKPWEPSCARVMSASRRLAPPSACRRASSRRRRHERRRNH